MINRHRLLALASAAAVSVALFCAAGAVARAQAPLALGSSRITIAGTSNIHAYTASTSTVRIVRADVGNAIGPDLWTRALTPGVVAAFEVAVPAASLTSPREGLDKNMHKALKVEQYGEISFRLARIEPLENGAAKVIGTLKISGVEREVALDINTRRTDAGLVVNGQTTLLMTDYGIKPPTAMLGMLKTDPKVTITFETTLSVSST